MKTRIALPLSVLWIVLGLVFGVQITNAQNTPVAASQSEPVLSGNGLKSEEVIMKTDAIFVGEITQMGFPSIKAVGRLSYYKNKVKVLQILRGTIEPQIKVTIYLYSVSDISETQPNIGTAYIFFIKKNDQGTFDPYTALKLLPATDTNITKVKKLIAAAPVSK